LKKPEAVALVKQLVQQCDVVVENYRGGVMDKLGLGWAELSQINPRLIYAAISGYEKHRSVEPSPCLCNGGER